MGSAVEDSDMREVGSEQGQWADGCDLFIPPTPLGTVLDLVPDRRPFFAPGKGSAADCAVFGGEVTLFSHLLLVILLRPISPC